MAQNWLIMRRRVEDEAANDESGLELSSLAIEILEYLQERNRARDTLTGITRAWIIKLRIEAMTRDVMKALTELIEKGLVIRESGADGQATYRLDRRKVRQVNALLRGARQEKL